MLLSDVKIVTLLSDVRQYFTKKPSLKLHWNIIINLQRKSTSYWKREKREKLPHQQKIHKGEKMKNWQWIKLIIQRNRMEGISLFTHSFVRLKIPFIPFFSPFLIKLIFHVIHLDKRVVHHTTQWIIYKFMFGWELQKIKSIKKKFINFPLWIKSSVLTQNFMSLIEKYHKENDAFTVKVN